MQVLFADETTDCRPVTSNAEIRVPIHKEQNREEIVQHPLFLYCLRFQIQGHRCQTWQNKSHTKREYSIETSGKFVISELHDIHNPSNDCVFREVKKTNPISFDDCVGHSEFDTFENFTIKYSPFRHT